MCRIPFVRPFPCQAAVHSFAQPDERKSNVIVIFADDLGRRSFVLQAHDIATPSRLCQFSDRGRVTSSMQQQQQPDSSPRPLPKIRPLLDQPKMVLNRPALTAYGEDMFSLRTERYRYIRYSDGSEELYDYQTDPHEKQNMVGAACQRKRHQSFDSSWLSQ